MKVIRTVGNLDWLCQFSRGSLAQDSHYSNPDRPPFYIRGTGSFGGLES